MSVTFGSATKIQYKGSTTSTSTTNASAKTQKGSTTATSSTTTQNDINKTSVFSSQKTGSTTGISNTTANEKTTNNVELTEEEKKTTVEDVLKAIGDFFSDNTISNLIGSLVDSEEVDISDIDTKNFITREKVFAAEDDNDSFKDYAKAQGINIENATNDELTAAYNKYNERVSQKNEFNELYDLFSSDDTLSKGLEDKVSIKGSLINKAMQGSLTEIHNEISETGAFKTKGEKGGIGYDKRFDTKVTASIDKMKAMLNDSNVSDDIKAKATEIINKYENQEKVAVGKRENSTAKINSEINESVKQQGTGDCYLLTTLNSLKETEYGKEIIKEAIKDNGDGSYTVNLKGVGMSYTFSNDEIEKAEKEKAKTVKDDGSVVGTGSDLYSDGDDDAMLIEMAIEKFREGIYDGTIKVNESWPKYASKTVSKEKHDAGKSALTSGTMQQTYFLLSGEQAESVKQENIDSTLSDIQKDMETNGSEYIIYAAVSAEYAYTENKEGDYYLDDVGNYKKVTTNTPEDTQRYSFNGMGYNSNKITLDSVNEEDKNKSISITNNSTGRHALSITNITDDSVTVINPWNSSIEVTVSREQFESYMYDLQYAKMPK